jgi:hypothetical protein
MTTKTKSNISTIGWYQIIGGGIGALIILYSLFTAAQLSGLNILIYVFMLLFFIYSIFCGTLCIQHKANALTHSLINQFLQLIGFAVFSVAFSYVAGLYLSVGLDLSNSVNMKFNIGISKFDFNINRELERAEINFNLVAFGLIYWIDKLMKKLKEEKADVLIASVGQS